MFKFITVAVTAATMALTPIAATPARAELDRGETIRLLIGLGLIGAYVVANERAKDRSRSSRSYRNDYPTVRVTPGYGRGKAYGHRRQALPARCRTDVPTRGGERVFYGRPCLERAGYRAQLPGQCARTLDFGRRQVVAYGERCLKRAGYRVRG